MMKKSNLFLKKIGFFIFLCSWEILLPFQAMAQQASTDTMGTNWEWGGFLKGHYNQSSPPPHTALAQLGQKTNRDYLLEARINTKASFTPFFSMVLNWELAGSNSDSYKGSNKLKHLFPQKYPNGVYLLPNDHHRQFNLTKTSHGIDRTFWYHRLDRAFFDFQGSQTEFRLGRQAVTWGHGFTFHPLDLFNPFSPDNLTREYKRGDDMALTQVDLGDGNLQIVYVPHQNPKTHKREAKQDSVGTKLNFSMGGADLDLLLAHHYQDNVIGIGIEAPLGDAAWRWDITQTRLNKKSLNVRRYFSTVLNVDYSWAWFGKNWYGFLETYYEGLSRNDYQDALADNALSQRIQRGEMFTLGSWYGSAHISVTLTPLLTTSLTGIMNLKDHSMMWLPQLVYSITNNMQFTTSASISQGKKQTEYGGYTLSNTTTVQQPSNSFSATLAWYF